MAVAQEFKMNAKSEGIELRAREREASPEAITNAKGRERLGQRPPPRPITDRL
jgi:hypothetical protein